MPCERRPSIGLCRGSAGTGSQLAQLSCQATELCHEPPGDGGQDPACLISGVGVRARWVSINAPDLISRSFEHSRVLLTGATGFLGQALLERILRCLPPSCHVVVAIRPSSRRTARQRLDREVLTSSAFDRLRSELGAESLAQMIADRVDVVSADLSISGLGLDGAELELVSACKVVIHSAAAVEFDNPVDLMVRTNLEGTLQLLEVVRPSRPRFVHVSTAYVSGLRRGLIPEAPRGQLPGDVGLDWRQELDILGGIRLTIEQESRSSQVLYDLHRRAALELGPAGAPAVGRSVERSRRRWVDNRLIERGRDHARAMGWADSYSFTKALAEQALVETHGEVPLAIVRPSIIESSLLQPQPGWLEGLRMADPMILAFGRGMVRDFPGLVDGILDVIPVDHVVSATLAAAGREEGWDQLSIYQVASGSLNPLRFGRLVELVSEYFTDNPLYDRIGEPIALPSWSFPRRSDMLRRLEFTDRVMGLSGDLLRQVPLGGLAGSWLERITEARTGVDRLRNFVELYGVYTEMDSIFVTDNSVELLNSLDRADRRDFDFDVTGFDWEAYLKEIHLPSVLRLTRSRDYRASKAPRRQPTGKTIDWAAAPSTAPPPIQAAHGDQRCLAVFDVDGTVLRSNVIEFLVWLRLKEQPLARWPGTLAPLAAKAPTLWRLEQQNRADFQREFYKQYGGIEVERLRLLGQQALDEFTLRRLFPAAVRRIRAHQRAGHQVLLLTGALDFIVQPLAQLFDVDLVCARLRERDGLYLGELADTPPAGEARAALLRAYAARRQLSLSLSFAYADSLSDLPMLEAVGVPFAVNPDAKLLGIARQRGWRVERWELPKGNHQLPLPFSWAG